MPAVLKAHLQEDWRRGLSNTVTLDLQRLTSGRCDETARGRLAWCTSAVSTPVRRSSDSTAVQATDLGNDKTSLCSASCVSWQCNTARICCWTLLQGTAPLGNRWPPLTIIISCPLGAQQQTRQAAVQCTSEHLHCICDQQSTTQVVY